MPPQFLFDISAIDLNKVISDLDEIRKINPHRGDMAMLDAVIFLDDQKHRLMGYKDVKTTDFWVAGHIPGRPLLPGVMMIEAGAQLASFYTKKIHKWEGFIGFGGVEDCRFRMAVEPPARLYIIGEQIWLRHGRVSCKMQGMVNGNIVCEFTIIGVRM